MPEHLAAAVEALNSAQTHSHRVERVLRWALSILAEQRRGDPVPAEIDRQMIEGMRSMAACQAGIAKAISGFRTYRAGIGAHDE